MNFKYFDGPNVGLALVLTKDQPRKNCYGHLSVATSGAAGGCSEGQQESVGSNNDLSGRLEHHIYLIRIIFILCA